VNDYIVVSDATLDLDGEMIGKCRVAVIPMFYRLGGEEHRYDPSAESFDYDSFYESVNRGEKVSTSQNPPAFFYEFYEKLTKDYKKILYICFSSGLSGNYNSARLAAGEMMEDHPDVCIKVIDSLCASAGEGLLVEEVCRKRDEGVSFEELAEYAESIKRDICHWFVVGNLDQLRRGGRISALEARLGSILNIHPVLTTDAAGKLKIMEKVRGMRKAVHSLLNHFMKYAAEGIGHRIIVVQAGCPEIAEQLKEMLMATGRIARCVIMNIGPIIGTHTGAPMFGVTFMGTQEE